MPSQLDVREDEINGVPGLSQRNSFLGSAGLKDVPSCASKYRAA